MAQFTTAEVAEKFGTTPRNLRKFLRADARSRGAGDTLPGKGARYALEGRDLAAMRKRFGAWQVEQAQLKAQRAADAAAELAQGADDDATD